MRPPAADDRADRGFLESEHCGHAARGQFRGVLHRLGPLVDDAQRIVEADRIGRVEAAELTEGMAGAAIRCRSGPPTAAKSATLVVKIAGWLNLVSRSFSSGPSFCSARRS